MEHQEPFKKLHRKLKRAIRLGQGYGHLIDALNHLDDKIAAENTEWVKRAYLYTNGKPKYIGRWEKV